MRIAETDPGSVESHSIQQCPLTDAKFNLQLRSSSAQPSDKPMKYNEYAMYKRLL